MEFVSARDLRINTGDVWKRLKQEKELVVTSNGRPVALMTGITGGSLEAILAAVRRARGEWAIRKMRESARTNGLDKISPDEIDEEIRQVRQAQKRTGGRRR